jgi:ParB family chromosome partitioning protein
MVNAILAKLVAGAFSAKSEARFGPESKGVTDEGVALVASQLDQIALNAALRERWNAAEYFDGAKKEHALRALEEALGADEAKAWANKKKGDIAAHATAVVPKTGWLPPQLRVIVADEPPSVEQAA